MKKTLERFVSKPLLLLASLLSGGCYCTLNRDCSCECAYKQKGVDNQCFPNTFMPFIAVDFYSKEGYKKYLYGYQSKKTSEEKIQPGYGKLSISSSRK